jgi:hypothetical protein
MEEKYFTGVADDPRPPEEKEKDWQAEEVASFAPVPWKEKSREEWRKFPIRDQDGSSTCVAQTGAKILGIDNQLEEGNFIEFSARDLYERRSNKPNEGMWGQDALSLMTKYGLTTEERLPSQGMSEAQINAPFTRTAEDERIARMYRAGGYVQLPCDDIEKIADIILNKGKGVMLFFWADYTEWNQDVPVITKPELTMHTANVHHSVTGSDAFLWKGEKAILIDDSWGKFYGLNGQRIITESFLKARCYFAGYILDLKNEPEQSDKPRHTFTKQLTFGMRNDADVKALQRILRYEGLFPAGDALLTGNYLQITAKGVLDWQKKREVAPLAELEYLQGRRCGPKTIKALNEKYGQ